MGRITGNRRRGNRILVVHPGAELYGSDRMAAETVAGLVDAGARVIVALPCDGPLVDEMHARGAKCVVAPMPVLRKAALRPAGMLRLAADAFRSLPATWALLRHRPDTVYVSTQTLPSWVVAARLSGARTICHVHEAERHPARVIELGMVAPLLGAHLIIANSEYAAGILRAAVPRLSDRIKVVHNGVRGPLEPTPPRSQVDGDLRVIYVGRLSPRKGVDTAVRAVRTLRARGVPVRLRIAGTAFDGYEWYEEHLRELAGPLLETGEIELVGFTPSVWDELSQADIAVVPSTLPEPFGNTAVEARLAARPVIASDTGGLPEALSGATASCLVAPDDADALAEALEQFRSRWPELRNEALADSETAADMFAPEKYRRAMVDELCKPKPMDGAPGTIRVLQSFPAPRATTNPYIVQLGQVLNDSPNVELMTFTWRRALLGRYDVFHMHWPETLLEGRTTARAVVRGAMFAGLILRLRATGVGIVRTVHNLDLPDMARPQQWLLRRLHAMTTVEIRINESTPTAARFDTMILHGHYRDWFATERRWDSVPGRIAFVGLLRRYKGVEHLIEVFAQIPRTDISLSISGRPTSPEIEQEVRAAASSDPRVVLDLRHLGDADLVRAVTQAQFVVLPYRFMHNSGSALAALSLDRPVLLPRNAATEALASEVGSGWVTLYDGELTPDALLAALDGAAMRCVGSPDLSRRNWDVAADLHLAAYRKALSLSRRSRTEVAQ